MLLSRVCSGSLTLQSIHVSKNGPVVCSVRSGNLLWTRVTSRPTWNQSLGSSINLYDCWKMRVMMGIKLLKRAVLNTGHFLIYITINYSI